MTSVAVVSLVFILDLSSVVWLQDGQSLSFGCIIQDCFPSKNQPLDPIHLYRPAMGRAVHRALAGFCSVGGRRGGDRVRKNSLRDCNNVASSRREMAVSLGVFGS